MRKGARAWLTKGSSIGGGGRQNSSFVASTKRRVPENRNYGQSRTVTHTRWGCCGNKLQSTETFLSSVFSPIGHRLQTVRSAWGVGPVGLAGGSLGVTRFGCLGGGSGGAQEVSRQDDAPEGILRQEVRVVGGVEPRSLLAAEGAPSRPATGLGGIAERIRPERHRKKHNAKYVQ